MPYLVRGNVEQIVHAFEKDWMIQRERDDQVRIQVDLPRVPFIGTEKQAVLHFDTWRKKAIGHYYLQGNMSAGNLCYLLGDEPLKKKNEDPEVYRTNFIRQDFAYINDTGEPCGFTVAYRKDDPKQWIISLVRRSHVEPKNRGLVFLWSSDLTLDIRLSDPEVVVSSVDLVNNPLMQQIDSSFLSEVVQNILTKDGAINLRFQRVKLLTRTLQIEQETATLHNPIVFTEVNLPSLFADNPALDLIVQYGLADNFHLSFAVFQDLLSESSKLRQEIEGLALTHDDRRINRNLLKILIVLYEKGLLEKNRQLLEDVEFVKEFSGYMWDETQIKLIPFLKERKYSKELMQLILSETEYYCSIDRLVELEPALTEDVPKFFEDPKKCDELKFIHHLSNEESKKLCLIFWVKGNLSVDGYQEIVHATNEYPLLASTLIALDQTKTIQIDELRKFALNPQQHLRKSIAMELNISEKSLPRLNTPELVAASKAFILLKKYGITDLQANLLVLEKGEKGQILRLLLPQLEKIENETQRKSLVAILYASVEHRNRAIVTNDPTELALRERCICASQIQSLGFDLKMVEFVVQEDSEAAARFRKVILRVEEQFKIVSKRFLESQSYSQMLRNWQKEKEFYRKSLYQIAYNALMGSNQNVRAELQKAEKKILSIVDPELKSDLQKALIVIANIIISFLTLGLANGIKYRNTGNCWFFNQTKSGEELRALDDEVFGLIGP